MRRPDLVTRNLTDERHTLALLHFKADVIKQAPVTIAVREVDYLQHALPHALRVWEGKPASVVCCTVSLSMYSSG